MHDDLEVLEPSGSSVTFRGERIEVLPLTIGSLPKLVRTARPVIDALLELDDVPGADDQGGLVTLLLNLIEQHGEKVYEAAALCIDRDPDWVAKADLGEFADLAMKVFEVNRDFFVQRLAPLLAGLFKNAPATNGDGPTPSSSSSSAGTA